MKTTYPSADPPTADGPQTPEDQGFEARRPDQAIAEIADSQHGVVTLDQLREAGLSPSAVLQRAEVGRLYRVHFKVYSVGHRPLTLDARRMATALACGPDAVLSHRSAAALWALRPESQAGFDVTAPYRRGRIPAGIEAHRNGSLRPDDLTSIRGIPCTTVARTLLDLAGVVGVSELRKAISEAEVLRVFDRAAIEGLIERNGGRRGVARLRMLVSELSPRTGRTRSQLEQRFLALCSRAGFPPPEVNCPLELGSQRLIPDFLWREARLIVETDGRGAHGTASAFERDRLRDQILSAAGWKVIRCTWRQVLDEPTRLASTLACLIAPHPPRRRASNP